MEYKLSDNDDHQLGGGEGTCGVCRVRVYTASAYTEAVYNVHICIIRSVA